LDLSDVTLVSGFARCEAIAAGNTAPFLAIIRELLTIPNGADNIWSAARTSLHDVIRSGSGGGSATTTGAASKNAGGAVIQQLNGKAVEGGAAYAQMSKLALALLTKVRRSAVI
jgi:hypothetical protein